VLIFALELNDSELLKMWLAYPLYCCVCVLISICDNRVLTREQMALQMEWIFRRSFRLKDVDRHSSLF